MARKKAMTRAEMISTLKSRGQKGALSKMTKPQLKALLERTAPPGAPSHDEKPRSDIALEPDERQVGGHYYRKNGETKSDGSHEHKSDPWPVSEASKAKKAPAKKARKRKLDPVENPDADITVALVNKRLNADRHPGTASKISGVKAERLRWLLRGREFGTRPITEEDVEKRLDGIDKEYNGIKEWRKYKDLEGEIDETNVREGKRARKKPDRLGEKAPDAFAKEKEDEQGGEGMSYHAFMRKHLKQHGGNMAKAAQAYREQKGGHYARADGSVLMKDKGKYGHTHKPGKNPAVTYEDAKSDEPEPARAPSPPARRATRNMDPRERRRLEREQRGRGAHDQDGGSLLSGIGDFGRDIIDGAKDAGEGIATAAQDTYDDALKPVGHFVAQHKDAFETAALIAGAVMMPGVGIVADTAALTAEGAETAATLAEATEGASAAVNPASVGDASAAAEANAATEGVTTESEGAANESAGKFKPTGARSLADINNQGRVGALKNLVSGADDGATRAQALYNSRYAAGIAAMDMANDVIQTDNKDLGSGGSGDKDTGSQQQMQQMQQQMQQQQDTMRRQAQQAAASAAQANAFAANAAALRHGDYLNPFG